jgi:hypothetical protein
VLEWTARLECPAGGGLCTGPLPGLEAGQWQTPRSAKVQVTPFAPLAISINEDDVGGEEKSGRGTSCVTAGSAAHSFLERLLFYLKRELARAGPGVVMKSNPAQAVDPVRSKKARGFDSH